MTNVVTLSGRPYAPPADPMSATFNPREDAARAYKDGHAAAVAMLHVGNRFEGGFNVADRIAPGGRYAQTGSAVWLRWTAAKLGAMQAITQWRDIITDDAGIITVLNPRATAPDAARP